MRSYIVKENHIGSAVSEILRYRQTNTDPVTFIQFLFQFQNRKSEKKFMEIFFWGGSVGGNFPQNSSNPSQDL